MTFQDKIKHICSSEGINVREFSELAGIPYGTIRNYYQGVREPKISQVEQISEVPKFKKYKELLMGSGSQKLLKEHIDLISIYDELEKSGEGSLLLEMAEILAERKKRRDKKG